LQYLFKKPGQGFYLTEKLLKAEVFDNFLNRYGEAKPISVFRLDWP
jgi:hypothetical protein